MHSIKIIYNSSPVKGVEISPDKFSETVEGPKGLPSEIFDNVLEIEKNCGLIYYAIQYVKNFTAENYMSSILLDADEKSLSVIRNVRKIS